MNQVSGFRFRVSGPAILIALLLFCTAPLFADSKDTNLKPLNADNTSAKPEPVQTTSPELEKKYRAELEKRLAEERDSYKGSLRSLWLANSAVWAVLLLFIIFQAVGARKRAAELARLKAQREGD